MYNFLSLLLEMFSLSLWFPSLSFAYIAISWKSEIVLLTVGAFGFIGTIFFHVVWIPLAISFSAVLQCPYFWHLKHLKSAGWLASWVECWLMVQETRVQYQVEAYQRLKKLYLILPCLTLSIMMYGSRVKWSNPVKGVAPSPTAQCCSNWKGSLQVTLD